MALYELFYSPSTSNTDETFTKILSELDSPAEKLAYL
jgi:hypothetical protein